MKTSYEFKNQKTRCSALKPVGVCKANEGQKPNLRNVLADDLKTVPRVRELFAQGVMVARKTVPSSGTLHRICGFQAKR